jgi:hypothetical protein
MRGVRRPSVKRVSTSTVLVAILFAILLWKTAVLAEAPAISLGRYSAVTESEWSLDLDLKQNGRAILTVASWDPGERNRAKVTTFSGRRRVEKTNIVVQYKDGNGVFIYHRRLNFDRPASSAR